MNELTKSQKKIFSKIIDKIEELQILKDHNPKNSMLSLTGSAGTGKTFLISKIVKYLKEKNLGFVLTSPTHKASGVISNILYQEGVQASSRTIHSFLGIKPFLDYKNGTETFKIDKTKKSKESTNVLVVDESSMISSELFNYIVDFVNSKHVNIVLFIGDPNQLLPISSSENEIYKLHNQYKLTKIVRQAEDSYIIKLANILKERIQKQDFIDLQKLILQNHDSNIKYFYNERDFLNDYYSEEDWYDKSKIIATYKNKNVDAFSRIVRKKYWTDKKVYKTDSLIVGDKLRFIDAYSVNDITIYHNGQEIVVSHAEKKWQNSLKIDYWECKASNKQEEQIFRVVDPKSLSIYNERLTYIANLAKKEKYYPKKKEIWKLFFELKEMYANIQYIYSSTIHKLQGSTYDTVYLDLFDLAQNTYMSDDEKYRLTYVAITRASKDVIIYMSSFEDTQVNNSINIQHIHNNIDDKLYNILNI